MAQVVILGAGLTGLSAAYHLEQLGFTDYRLFEKEPTVGGLCRSIEQDGFTFDYTGHLLHINNEYVRQLIAKIAGFDQFTAIERRAFIESHGTQVAYPYQMNLYGLPVDVIAECIEGYLTRTARKTDPTKTQTFHSWVRTNFGDGLAKHFFFPYQEKIFDLSVKKFTASWTNKFVPATSLTSMLTGALQPQANTKIGYNAHFWYPKQGGINELVSKLHQTLSLCVHTGYCVETVDLAHKIVTFTNGHAEPFETLISTIPLDILLTKLHEKSDTSFAAAAPKLMCTSVINFTCGVNRPDLPTNRPNTHWIYYPESQFPFYRVGFPHNFSHNLVPAGCSSLSGEASMLKRDRTYQTQLMNACRTSIKKVFTISEQEIITEQTMVLNHAYVIFDRWRDQHINQLLKQLETNHVYSIGRFGGWKYSSMQDAFLDGQQVANTLVQELPMHTMATTQPKRSVL